MITSASHQEKMPNVLTKAIDICKEEDANEKSNFEREVDGRSDGVDPLDTRALNDPRLLAKGNTFLKALHALLLIIMIGDHHHLEAYDAINDAQLGEGLEKTKG